MQFLKSLDDLSFGAGLDGVTLAGGFGTLNKVGIAFHTSLFLSVGTLN